MAVEVKEREYWTPGMLDFVERAKPVIEENFLPYRVLFNHTPWLQLRVTMPDIVDRLWNAPKDANPPLFGRGVPKEFGGYGFNCLQDGLVAAELIKIAKSCFGESYLGSSSFQVQTLNWSKYPEVKDKYMKRIMQAGRAATISPTPRRGWTQAR